MGSLQQDPSGHWHACFRFAGKRFKRSLHTKSESNTMHGSAWRGDGAQLLRALADSLST